MHHCPWCHVAATHTMSTWRKNRSHGFCKCRRHGCADRRARCPRRRNKSAAALLTAAWIVGRGTRRRFSTGSVLTASPWLITVIWVLTLVPELFFFGQPLPRVLDFFGLLTPLFANKLGYLWVRKTGVLRCDGSLMMLTVEDKCFQHVSYSQSTVPQNPPCR
jgi:hypothetical protein